MISAWHESVMADMLVSLLICDFLEIWAMDRTNYHVGWTAGRVQTTWKWVIIDLILKIIYTWRSKNNRNNCVLFNISRFSIQNIRLAFQTLFFFIYYKKLSYALSKVIQLFVVLVAYAILKKKTGLTTSSRYLSDPPSCGEFTKAKHIALTVSWFRLEMANFSQDIDEWWET